MNDIFEPLDIPKPKPSVAFNFDISQVDLHGKPIITKRNDLGKRIRDLIDRFNSETDSPPGLMEQLLNFYKADGSYDVRKIVIFGRVLVKLGELLKDFEPLDQQSKMIEYVSQHPDFMALVFGDFGEATERFLGDFSSPDPSQDSSLFK